MSTFAIVSEEFTNRNQLWMFEGIYRNSSTLARVAIQKGADQSHANVEVWNQHHGWLHFTSLPVEEWYGDTASYVKKFFSDKDKLPIFDVRHRLLEKLALGLYGSREVEIRKALS